MGNIHGVREIYLYPGQRWFGSGVLTLRTLLGSCVSMTLWHPRHQLGGMCHYLLPTDPTWTQDRPKDARYADEAIALFMEDLTRTGTRPVDYQVGLFGGSNMFAALGVNNQAGSIDVGRRNAAAGRELLQHHGFRGVTEDLGGEGHRQVTLDLRDGSLWLRRGSGKLMPVVAR